MLAHKGIPCVVSIGCLLFNQCGAGIRQSLKQTHRAEDAGPEQLLALVADPAAAPAKARVVIMGNVDTGKSSVCQWLLARTDVCAVHKDIAARTTTTELATGHWFGNPANGELEVLDTPGFLLDGTDGVNFIDLVQKIKDLGKIDAIIMTSSLSGETGAFHYKTMTQLRHTFGSAMWENLVHFLKVEQWFASEYGRFAGETPASFETHLAYWSTTFLSVEKSESTNKGVDWNLPVHAEALQDLETDISNTCYKRTFGARLLVNEPHLSMTAADVGYADASQNAVSKIGDVKYGLVPLRTSILALRTSREGGGQWDVENLRARFGPSSVNPDQEFECKWPHTCNMTITGDYLSDADRVRIFPTTHTCGTPFDARASFVVPVSHNEARPRLGDAETAKFFDMGATISFEGANKEYTVCYCEYGNCDSDQRYHQKVGTLKVEDTKCPVPCTEEATLHATLVSGLKEGETCGAAATIRPGGDILTYQCSTGYGIDHDATKKTFTQTCDAHSGTLTTISPCPIVQCKTPPPTPGNSHRLTATVENMVYVYQQPLLFKCNSFAGDYEERKLATPLLEEEAETLDPVYTLDSNRYGSQRIDMTCNADGNWELQGDQTLANFVADGGCRRWTVGDFGECTAQCGAGTHDRPLTCDPTRVDGSPGKCLDSRKPTSTKPCSSFQGCPDCGEAAPDLSKVHAVRAYDADKPAPTMKTEGEPVIYTCDYHNGYNLDGSGKTSYTLTNFQVACKLDGGSPKLEWTKYGASDNQMQAEDLAKGCRKWETTEWSDCSVTCGSGVRSRKIQCTTGDDNDCAPEARPTGVVLSRNCYVSDACAISEEALTDGKGGGSRAAIGFLFLVPLLVLLGLTEQ